MKKKIVISIGSIVIFVIGLVFFLSTGGQRTDVILTHYSLSEDNEVMTLHINVVGSMGYVRGLKVKQGGDNKYITFYSTYGLNNSIGAKSEFEVQLNPSCEEIYFYSGDGGYRLVLKKMGEKNEWHMV